MTTPNSTSPSPRIDRGAEPPLVGEYNGFEVYPMPFFATLTASEPEALGRWYERALGFGLMLAGPLVHLRRRKYQDLLIVRGVRGENSQRTAVKPVQFVRDAAGFSLAWEHDPGTGETVVRLPEGYGGMLVVT